MTNNEQRKEREHVRRADKNTVGGNFQMAGGNRPLPHRRTNGRYKIRQNAQQKKKRETSGPKFGLAGGIISETLRRCVSLVAATFHFAVADRRNLIKSKVAEAM
jgi:hypothetical protein